MNPIIKLTNSVIEGDEKKMNKMLKTCNVELTKKDKESNTEIEIDTKFTPLFDKKPLFCRVAPRNESKTLPKKPKKTEKESVGEKERRGG